MSRSHGLVIRHAKELDNSTESKMLRCLTTMVLFSLFGCASRAPHIRESLGTVPPDVGSPFPPPTWARFDSLPPEPSSAAGFDLQARIIRGTCGANDAIES